MDGIRELKAVLKQGLGWHGARIDLLARLICALFQVKTVNLAPLATALSGRASLEAHYKRLQRLFRGFELDYGTLARLLVVVGNDSPENGGVSRNPRKFRHLNSSSTTPP
jgi:hypothetical protein